MRRPEMARAMTSCWISLVPSTIVWIFESLLLSQYPWSSAEPEESLAHTPTA
jgi:hypothetical protein